MQVLDVLVFELGDLDVLAVQIVDDLGDPRLVEGVKFSLRLIFSICTFTNAQSR